MFSKLFMLGASALVSLGLLGFAPPPDRGDGPPPPPKKKGHRPGPEDDLPKPPGGTWADEAPDPLRHDLRKAYDRLSDADSKPASNFYRDAARDLYNAARRDAEAGRYDRAGELARAADAMTHVIEHL